jgi:hypothetical protein
MRERNPYDGFTQKDAKTPSIFAWSYTNMHGYKVIENNKRQWHIHRKQDRLARIFRVI